MIKKDYFVVVDKKDYYIVDKDYKDDIVVVDNFVDFVDLFDIVDKGNNFHMIDYYYKYFDYSDRDKIDSRNFVEFEFVVDYLFLF